MFPSCLCSDILAFLPCLVQKTYKFDEERSIVTIFLIVEFTHFGEHFLPLNFWSGNGQALLETLRRGSLEKNSWGGVWSKGVFLTERGDFPRAQ